jgi:integrase
MDIVTFLEHDGKPPDIVSSNPPKESTFAELRDSYLRVHGNGTIEANTLGTYQLHLGHFAKSLGEQFPINTLSLADLQRHVDRRGREKNRSGDIISPVTIKKEIATLSGAWTWGCRMGMVSGEFPGQGLRYPKIEEPLPFMTWQEIERAIAAGGDPDELWECLYLTLPEIGSLLAHVKEHAAYPFVYPMFCFAAHTGARRSEMLRAQVTDIDLEGKTVVIHEKKRARGKRTTRRVPLTPFLQEALVEWLKAHPGSPWLFCLTGIVPRSKTRSGTTGHKGMKTRKSSQNGRRETVRQRQQFPSAALSRKESYGHFKRTLKGSKWEVLRGWHVLRHSFISACASRGLDQRLIDEFVGHQTDEQRKRYTHLYPSTKQEAIKLVFG